MQKHVSRHVLASMLQGLQQKRDLQPKLGWAACDPIHLFNNDGMKRELILLKREETGLKLIAQSTEVPFPQRDR